MITSTDVYLAARELLGTPYVHKGRKKDIGIDCIGVPIWVANRLNLEDLNVTNYGRTPDGTMQKRVSEVCPSGILVPGALVVFKIKAVPQHCGIISLDNLELGLIHAWDIAGMVCEHKLTQQWRDRIMGCYRLPGVRYD